MSELAPVAPPERVVVLDVLRGCALFGVLVANVRGSFSGHWFGAVPPAAHPLDGAAGAFVDAFVAGKAMTLLTILFGLGFAMQLERADARGEPIGRVYARRLLALFAFGAAHVVLLWWGDVLWTYALCGFALLAFRRASPRALLAAALALVIVPQVLMAIPALGEAVREALPHPEDRRAFRRELLAAMRGSDYSTLLSAHLHQALYHESFIAGWFYPWVIGRFLLGHYAGRRRLLEADGAAHLPLFRRLLVGGAVLGMAGLVWGWLRQVYDVVPLAGRLALVAFSELGLLGLTLAYASLAVLLFQRPRWRRLLLVVAPVGRMPLTTYLSQSVAATFVFYGWGLGLAGSVGAAACVGISVAIFAAQIAIAHLWLRRFRFGPAEWLWRRLAYGRRPPMRL